MECGGRTAWCSGTRAGELAQTEAVPLLTGSGRRKSKWKGSGVSGNRTRVSEAQGRGRRLARLTRPGLAGPPRERGP